MPQAIGMIIGAVATKFVAGGALGATLAGGIFPSLIGTIVSGAVNFMVSGSMANKPESPDYSNLFDRSTLIRKSNPSREYIYGRVRKSGCLGYHYTSEDNHYFYAAIIVASHPCEEIEYLCLGDDILRLDQDFDTDENFNTTGISHYVANDNTKYNQHVWLDIKLGTSADANSRFLSECGGTFRDTDVYYGMTVIFVKYRFCSELFKGVPNTQVIIQGKNDIYDYRTSSTAYTTNTVLCLVDYLTDSILGPGITDAELNTTLITTAANECDESVTMTGAIENAVPEMTSDTAPYGVVSTNSYIEGYSAYKAFDASNLERWEGYTTDGSGTPYIEYQFVEATQISEYMLKAAHVGWESMPVSWTIKGSETGEFAGEEVTLDSDAKATWAADEEGNYDIDTPGSYTYYRLYPGNPQNGSTRFGIGTIELYTKTTVQDRYTCNGVITAGERISDNIEHFLNSMAGTMAYVNGKFCIKAGAYQTPAITITEDDIITSLSLSKPGRQDKFNTIKGQFISPKEDWRVTDFPPIDNSSYISADGEVLYKDVNYRFVNSDVAAQRLSKIDLERHRQDLSVSLVVSLRQWDIAAGDTIMVTYADWGWTSKVFDVISRSLVSMNDSNNDPLFAIRLNLRETASTVYDWSSEETLVDIAPNTNLGSLTLDDLENLSLDSSEQWLIRGNNGRIVTRIKATWTQHENIFVQDGGKVEVQYRKSTESSWTHSQVLSGDATSAFISDVDDRSSYYVRIRPITIFGGIGAWTTSSIHTVIGKTSIPPNVTGFTVSENLGVVSFYWDDLGIVDVYGYEIRYGSSGTSWKNGIPVTIAKQATAETSKDIPPGTWTFMIKAVDHIGQYSKAASVIGPVTVSNANVVLEAISDGTFPGTLNNFVKHYTNVLVPEDQHTADYYGYSAFDYFVPVPERICTYTSEEIDLGADDDVRVWAQIDSELGPGVVTGVANPRLQLIYRAEADEATITSTSTLDLITSTGVFYNCIQHYTGAVVPDSESLASEADYEVFDNFVYNAYENCYYETPETDLGADVNVLLYATVDQASGPSESGTPESTIYLKTKTSISEYADTYSLYNPGTYNLRYYTFKLYWNNVTNVSYIDGFECENTGWRFWSVGNLQDVRYIQARIRLDTNAGLAKITNFEWTIDS